MTNRPSLLLPILLLAGCPSTVPDDPAPPADGVPIDASFPYWMVVVPASIEGAAPQAFLLDTGANELALAPAVADAVGGNSVDTLEFGGRAYSDLRFVEHDLGLVSQLLAVDLAGNLGEDVLSDRAIALDYQRSLVVPWDEWTDDIDVGDHTTGAVVTADFTLGGQDTIVLSARFEDMEDPVNVLLDTGTNSAVISRALSEELGMDQDGRTVLRGSSSVAGGGAGSTEIVRVASCTVGDVSPQQMWASVVSNLTMGSLSNAVGVDVDAIVGGTFLREFLSVIDYPNSQLHLLPYGDLDHVVDEFRTVGVEVLRRDGAWFVFTVFTGSDAEAQGIETQDELVALDGAPAADMSLDEVLGLLRGEPGTSLSVTYSRDGVESTVDVLREDLLPALGR